MATIVNPSTFIAHTKALAAAVTAAFKTIYDDYNGNIRDVNCAADMGLDGSKLADATITGGKLHDETVTTEKLEDQCVTGPKLVDGTVTELKLGADAVTADKIHSAAVGDSHVDYTSVKLPRMGMVGQKIAWGYKSPYSIGSDTYGSVTITFATDAVGGDPAFSAAPTYAEVNIVYVSGGTKNLKIHIEAVSQTAITAVAQSIGAGADFGVYWMAIGTAP